jgi:hypothetical protein
VKKKFFPMAGACALLACGAISSSAYGGPNGGPPQDLVTGGGISDIGTSLGFNAHSGPLGEDPRGHVTLKNKGLEDAVSDRKGKVVCLRVQGNRAIVGFEDQDADGNPVYREIFAEDNGEPRGGQPVDRLAGIGPRAGFQTPPPPQCRANFPAAGFGLVLQHGNINVSDGTPKK